MKLASVTYNKISFYIHALPNLKKLLNLIIIPYPKQSITLFNLDKYGFSYPCRGKVKSLIHTITRRKPGEVIN